MTFGFPSLVLRLGVIGLDAGPLCRLGSFSIASSGAVTGEASSVGGLLQLLPSMDRAPARLPLQPTPEDRSRPSEIWIYIWQSSAVIIVLDVTSLRFIGWEVHGINVSGNMPYI
jgi:hypothetical protein